jgi:hypothetical protein
MALAAGGFISAFPTRLLGEYIGEDEPERVAVTIYGINLFLASVLVSALWRFAVRERLIRSDIADTDVRMITRRLAPGLAGYLVVIVVGLFLPVLAVLGYLVIAVYIIVPFGTLRRRRGCDMTREGRPANLTRVKRLDDAVVIRLAATTDLMDGDGSTKRRLVGGSAALSCGGSSGRCLPQRFRSARSRLYRARRTSRLRCVMRRSCSGCWNGCVILVRRW